MEKSSFKSPTEVSRAEQTDTRGPNTAKGILGRCAKIVEDLVELIDITAVKVINETGMFNHNN